MPVLPFIQTNPREAFRPQVKNAVVIPEVKIKRAARDTRPALVFSALYLKPGIVIARTTYAVIVGPPVEL